VKAFLAVLPTRWRQKSTGIDTGQNYVTVTLFIRQEMRQRVLSLLTAKTGKGEDDKLTPLLNEMSQNMLL